jgi:mRNA interferase MazF
MELNQFQIVLVNIDPTIGNVTMNTRTYVIVSPNEMNQCLQTILVAPMTTASRKYPTRIEVKHDNKTGRIVMDQIRTIDKQRIVRTLGRLSNREVKEVKTVMKEAFID